MRLPAFSCFAGIVLAISGGMAHAQGMYAGLSIGGGVDTDEFSDSNSGLKLSRGFVTSGHVGADLGSVLLEAETAYRYNSIEKAGGADDSGSMWSSALMGNVYYQYEFGVGDQAGFALYGGFGLGFARVAMDSTTLLIDDIDTTMAYQFIIGVNNPLTETWSMYGDLRGFLAIPEFEDSNGASDKQRYKVVSGIVGLRYHF